MKPREALNVFNKWMDCKDAYHADSSCDGRCPLCEYYTSDEDEREAMLMAISALEKQEQANTQNINSMRTSRPNALKSLNILEQAKDDKGCVPMSLVRQAFRNVIEQDRWIPVTERLPEEETDVLICNADGDIAISRGSMSTESTESWIWYTSGWRFGKVTAWRPLPEPYTEEES